MSTDTIVTHDSATPQESICPICLKNKATVRQTVDVYSDTTIKCCENCADWLIRLGRYQWYGNAPKKWIKANQNKIDRAHEALSKVYEREFQARQKRLEASDGGEVEAE